MNTNFGNEGNTQPFFMGEQYKYNGNNLLIVLDKPSEKANLYNINISDNIDYIECRILTGDMIEMFYSLLNTGIKTNKTLLFIDGMYQLSPKHKQMYQELLDKAYTIDLVIVQFHRDIMDTFEFEIPPNFDVYKLKGTDLELC